MQRIEQSSNAMINQTNAFLCCRAQLREPPRSKPDPEEGFSLSVKQKGGDHLLFSNPISTSSDTEQVSHQPSGSSNLSLPHQTDLHMVPDTIVIPSLPDDDFFHDEAIDVSSDIQELLAVPDTVSMDNLNQDMEPTPFQEGVSFEVCPYHKDLFVVQEKSTTPVTRHLRTVSSVFEADITASMGTEQPSKWEWEGTAPPMPRKRAKLAETLPNPPKSKRPRVYKPLQEARWDEFFQALLEFKEQHGHCHVPHTYSEDPALARWAKRQRYQYKLHLEQKTSTMTVDRLQKLESVGFIWEPQTSVWETRRLELEAFLKEHGDCNVPCRYSKNPQLGMWVKRQRRQYKLFQAGVGASKLSAERFQILSNMGFEWNRRCDGFS